MAKGVTDVHRVSKFAANPADAIADIAVDAGTDLLMKHMLRKNPASDGIIARDCPKEEAVSRPQTDGDSTSHECGANAICAASAPTATSSASEIQIGLKPVLERVQNAVFGASGSFSCRGGITRAAQDDIRLCQGVSSSSNLDEQGSRRDVFDSRSMNISAVNPAHKAAISMMVSMMIGCLTSGAMPAIASHSLDPFFQGGTVLEEQASIRSSPSILTASSPGGKMPGDQQSFLAVGGMAASTAFKLLRSGA